MYTNDQMTIALLEVTSIINRCERIHVKFQEGTSQHTLLNNRLHAMYMAKAILTKNLTNQSQSLTYDNADYERAFPPILSIISKCETAQSKYEVDSKSYNRYQKTIDNMKLIHSSLKEEYEKLISEI